MQLRAALVDAGAVPLLSAAAAAAAEVDIERSIASARALAVLAAGGSSCRAAVATTSVATSLVCLLQVRPLVFNPMLCTLLARTLAQYILTSGWSQCLRVLLLAE